MENVELTAAIGRWVTVRKELEKERSSKALVEKVLQKASEMLNESADKGKVVDNLTIDLSSKGNVVLLCSYEDCEVSADRAEWNTELTRNEKIRQELGDELESYFKQYPDLRILHKAASYDETSYIEIKISVKAE